MGRLSNRGFSFVILLTEVVVSDLRSVHAPVASHAARRHGRVRHRAGPVVAARRERGQRARASLPGGLHQVSPGRLISRASAVFAARPLSRTPAVSLLSKCVRTFPVDPLFLQCAVASRTETSFVVNLVRLHEGLVITTFSVSTHADARAERLIFTCQGFAL